MILRLPAVVILCVTIVACTTTPSAPSGTDRGVQSAFAEGAWELRVDRAWAGGGNVQFPSDPLDESTYAPMINAPVYRVILSDSGRRVAVGATPLLGTRSLATDSRVQFDLGIAPLDAPAGGRLVVRRSGSDLQGELTVYGSGRPIVKSERGAVVPVR